MNHIVPTIIECEIKDVSNLCKYRNLTTLIVDKNKLRSLEIFPVIETLQTFCCNNNEIEDLVHFMDEVNEKFVNLKYLSMMRNPACPSLMNIEGLLRTLSHKYSIFFIHNPHDGMNSDPDLDDNKMFRLYVLYRMPQLQMIDCEAVTAIERSEAAVRGQFAVKLKRVSRLQQVQCNYDQVENGVSSEIAKDNQKNLAYEDTINSRGFQARLMKKSQVVSAPSKSSEGNRFISNQQL